VPDAALVTDPYETDRKMFVAWGLAARTPQDVKKMFLNEEP
jgi:hypothetical protein